MTDRQAAVEQAHKRSSRSSNPVELQQCLEATFAHPRRVYHETSVGPARQIFRKFPLQDPVGLGGMIGVIRCRAKI